MPSCDASRYQSMARQLLAAAQAQDWTHLGQLDALLRQWIEATDWAAASAAEKTAWRHVAHAHAQALDACHSARLEAGVQLQHLQNSQEAQKAYAWQEVWG